MSGGPTTTTNQKQNGTTSGVTSALTNLSGSTGPWNAAVPALNNVLQTAQGVPLQPNLTPNQSAAFSGIQGATSSAANLNPAIMSDARGMLQGGGVGANNNYITGALDKSNAALSPYLGTSFLDPMTNPYLAPALSGLQDQITNANKDAFSASGRFGASGDFTKANALGLSQGMAPLLMNQFNTNAGLQQGATGQMVNNNIAGAGQLDTSAVNRANVMGMAPNMVGSTYTPYLTALQAANQAVQQPWTNLGYASQFLTPFAGLGSTNQQAGNASGTSSSTSQGTSRGVTQVKSDPLQTALGGGLGLLSLFG